MNDYSVAQLSFPYEPAATPAPELLEGPDVCTEGTAASFATFSKCRTYRYVLGRVWRYDRPPLVAVLLNPSTADATRLDPTLRRVRAFAQRDGLGGFVLLNCFALRSTDRRGLLRRDVDVLGPRNTEAIRKAIARVRPQVLLAAWGSPDAPHVAERMDAVRAMAPYDWHVLGLTRKGYPRHPLYVPKTAPIVPWHDPKTELDA